MKNHLTRTMQRTRWIWCALGLTLGSAGCGESDGGDKSDQNDEGDGGRGDGSVDTNRDGGDGGGRQDAARPDAGGDAGGSNDADGGQPRTGVGADCSDDKPCPTGLRCDTPSACPLGSSCPEVCVRDTTSCVDDPCAADEWCQPFSGAAKGICQPRAAQGEPCLGPPGGRPSINTCADGLFCSGDGDTDGTCVPVLRAGAICPSLWLGSDRQACVEGYTCMEPTYEDPAICMPVKKLGEACVNSTDCAEGLRCLAQECVEE